MYCFVRPSHTYLDVDVDVDAGRDFDAQVVVQFHLVEQLQRELACVTRHRGRRAHVGAFESRPTSQPRCARRVN